MSRSNEIEVERLPAAQAAPASHGGALAMPARGQATALAESASRAWAETRAMMEYAREVPRDEEQAREKVAKSCSRPQFADSVDWEYERGRKKDEKTGEWVPNLIRGPSVYLAREVARCWKHVNSSVRILEDDGESIHGESICHDLETNTRSVKQWKVKKLIQRKVKVWNERIHRMEAVKDPTTGKDLTEWIVPDERDLLELCNRTASKCLRNAILEVIPDDVIQEARQIADETLEKFARGEIDQRGKPIVKAAAGAPGMAAPAVVDRLIGEFRRLGVSLEMIERKLGHKADEMSVDEYKLLARGGASIKGQTASIAEVFPEPDAGPSADAPAPEEASGDAQEDDPFGRQPAATLDEVVAREAKGGGQAPSGPAMEGWAEPARESDPEPKGGKRKREPRQ